MIQLQFFHFIAEKSLHSLKKDISRSFEPVMVRACSGVSKLFPLVSRTHKDVQLKAAVELRINLKTLVLIQMLWSEIYFENGNDVAETRKLEKQQNWK